jgi:hypothetical protein
MPPPLNFDLRDGPSETPPPVLRGDRRLHSDRAMDGQVETPPLVKASPTSRPQYPAWT